MNKLFNPDDKLSGSKILDKYLDDYAGALVKKTKALLEEIKNQDFIRSDLCKRCDETAIFLFKENNFYTCNRCKIIIDCFIKRGYGKKSFEL
jgi:hypothetical protein